MPSEPRREICTRIVNDWARDVLLEVDKQFPGEWPDDFDGHIASKRQHAIKHILQANYPWHAEFELRALIAGEEGSDDSELTQAWPAQLADISLDDESDFFGDNYMEYNGEEDNTEQSFLGGFHFSRSRRFLSEESELSQVFSNTATDQDCATDNSNSFIEPETEEGAKTITENPAADLPACDQSATGQAASIVDEHNIVNVSEEVEQN